MFQFLWRKLSISKIKICPWYRLERKVKKIIRLLIRSERYIYFELDEYLTGEIHKRIKDTFLCYKQKYDLLSYADEDIIGVTFPKF